MEQVFTAPLRMRMAGVMREYDVNDINTVSSIKDGAALLCEIKSFSESIMDKYLCFTIYGLIEKSDLSSSITVNF